MSCSLAREEQNLQSRASTLGGLSMPDFRGRKEGNPVRTRPRPSKPDAPPDFRDNILDEETTATAAPPRAARNLDEEEHIGFDAETNSRYEEIKRGTTHISELQQMTMAQLIVVAREENLS